MNFEMFKFMLETSIPTKYVNIIEVEGVEYELTSIVWFGQVISLECRKCDNNER